MKNFMKVCKDLIKIICIIGIILIVIFVMVYVFSNFGINIKDLISILEYIVNGMVLMFG